MDQNMILNEVIEIMHTQHKFKATQVFLCFSSLTLRAQL